MARKDQEPTVVEEPRVADASDLIPGAERIDAIQVEVAEPVKEPTGKYWCGTIAGAPRHIFYAGGQDFPQESENVTHDRELNQTNRVRVRGTEVDLTPTRVETIKRAVQNKVVRVFRDVNGNLTGGHPLNTDDGRYVRDPDRDEPVAKYLYMVKLSDRMPHNYRGMTPPTMLRPVGAK